MTPEAVHKEFLNLRKAQGKSQQEKQEQKKRESALLMRCSLCSCALSAELIFTRPVVVCSRVGWEMLVAGMRPLSSLGVCMLLRT